MGIFKRIKNFFSRKKKEDKGIGSVETNAEIKEENIEEVQTTFCEASLDELVEEGVVENVVSCEN